MTKKFIILVLIAGLVLIGAGLFLSGVIEQISEIEITSTARPTSQPKNGQQDGNRVTITPLVQGNQDGGNHAVLPKDPIPILLNADNFLAFYESYKDFPNIIVRGTAFSRDRYRAEVEILEKITASNAPVLDLRLGFQSLTLMQASLTVEQIEWLKEIGVTTLTYNLELGPRAPRLEFSRRQNTDEGNPIIQFGEFATQNGFRAIWVPLRGDADAASDTLLQMIYSTGIDGYRLTGTALFRECLC